MALTLMFGDGLETGGADLWDNVVNTPYFKGCIARQYAHNTNNNTQTIWGDNYVAQTFTVGSVGWTLDRIGIFLDFKTGSPANLEVALQGVDGSSHPDNSDIVTANIAAADIEILEWTYFDITPTVLSASTQYAVVFRQVSDGGSGSDYYRADCSTTTNPLPNGSLEETSNGGSTWITKTNQDLCFRVGHAPITGKYNLNVIASGSYAYLEKDYSTTNAYVFASFNLFINVAPDGDCNISEVLVPYSGPLDYFDIILKLTSDRKLKTGTSTGSTQLDVGTRYRISFEGWDDSGTRKLRAWIDGVLELDDVAASGSTTTDNANTSLGVLATGTTDLYFDDFVLFSDTSSVGDQGNILILGARPVSNSADDWDVGNDEWQDRTGGVDQDITAPDYTRLDDDPPDTDEGAWEEADGIGHYLSFHLDDCGSGNLADIGGSDTIVAVNFAFYYNTAGGGADEYGCYGRNTSGKALATWVDDPKDPTWIDVLKIQTWETTPAAWSQSLINSQQIGMTCRDANKDMWWYEAFAMIFFIPVGGADIQKTVNDSLGITDTETTVRTVVRTIAESMGVTDTDSKIHVAIRTVAESLGITDAATGIKGIIRTVADPMGITDAEARVCVTIRILAESLGVTDAATRVSEVYRVIAESLGITDSMDRVALVERVVAELLGITDTMTRVREVIRTVADSLGLTDAVAKDEALVLVETLGIADAMIRVVDVYRTETESLGITDSADRVALVERIIAESLGVTDAMTRVRGVYKIVADSLGLTDAVAKDEALVLSDDLGLTDSITRVCIVIRAIAESMNITDDVPRVWEVVRMIADSLGITDEVIPLKTLEEVINDGLGLTDTTSRVHIVLRILSESLGLTDAVAKVCVVNRIVSDSVGITDGTVLDRLIVVADALGIIDSVTRIIDYVRTQDDDVGLIDAMTRVAVAIRTVNESLGIADEVTRAIDCFRTQDDDVSLVDVATRVIDVIKILDESLGTTDDVIRLVDYVRTQDDDVGLIDAMTRVIGIIRTINDDLGITDEVSGQLGALIKVAWAFMIMRQTHS